MAPRIPRPRPYGPVAIAAVALIVAMALGLIVALVVVIVGPRHTPVAPAPPPQRCLAVAGDFASTLDLEQSGNAAIIAGESIRRGLPARAATIALAAAWQESGLRNLDHGDRDSVGLFQQRPSQGWGTIAQIMDPWYAAGAFYDALVKVPGWQTGDINDVAQAVQRSGVPDGYRPHESDARAWASTLTGNSPAALTCLDRGTTPGDAAAISALLTRIWGQQVTIEPRAGGLLVSTPTETTAWAVAQIALAGTGLGGVAAVQVGTQTFTVDPTVLAVWRPAPTPGTSPVAVTGAAPATGSASATSSAPGTSTASPSPLPPPATVGATQVWIRLR